MYIYDSHTVIITAIYISVRIRRHNRFFRPVCCSAGRSVFYHWEALYVCLYRHIHKISPSAFCMRATVLKDFRKLLQTIGIKFQLHMNFAVSRCVSISVTDLFPRSLTFSHASFVGHSCSRAPFLLVFKRTVCQFLLFWKEQKIIWIS